MTSSWQRQATDNWDCYTGKESLLARGTVTLAKTQQWQGGLSHWQRLTTGLRNCHTGKDSPLAKGTVTLAKTHHWQGGLSH